MLCDVYIMPLWRFKAGDICLAEAADQTSGSSASAGRGPLQALRKFWARDAVRRIRSAVEAENDVTIDWRDEGPLVYHRAGEEFQALRAYARWLESPAEGRGQFETPPAGNYYKHAVWKAKRRCNNFPQLVDHDCCFGYYLPCAFERLTRVEPRKVERWTFLRAVGSSPRLLDELQRLGMIFAAESAAHIPDDATRHEVLAAHRQLCEIAELSCLHGLPVILGRQGYPQRTRSQRRNRALAFWPRTASTPAG